ncbi:hypothetical protein XELAEV_18010759mg [Xenopus laevis]|uniref:Uncharacterized protein n=1 Tax=Xenopus laevis TaxID=8355 RepID=A0A974I232_XENLA|nr:hypothetical protein XELAEV_18010759mg [Xenopus laevis]
MDALKSAARICDEGFVVNLFSFHSFRIWRKCLWSLTTRSCWSSITSLGLSRHSWIPLHDALKMGSSTALLPPHYFALKIDRKAMFAERINGLLPLKLYGLSPLRLATLGREDHLKNAKGIIVFPAEFCQCKVLVTRKQK